jgi:Undecaprenyl-phosphate glucose phosphotransferase
MPGRFFLITKRWHLIAAAQLLDMLLVLSIALLTYTLIGHRVPGIDPARYAWAAAAIGVACHFGFARGHLYEIECIRDATKANRHLLVHWTRIFVFFAAVAALSHKEDDFSRIWFVCLYFGGALMFIAERVVLARVYQAGLRHGFYRESVAVLGRGPIAEDIVRRLSERADVYIVGAYDPDPIVPDGTGEIPYVGPVPLRGSIDALLALSRNMTIDSVVLAVPHTTCGGLRSVISQLAVQPFEIRVAPESVGLDGVGMAGSSAADFHGICLLPVADKPISDLSFSFKCAAEWTIAALILLMIAPVLAVCAIGIKRSSPGPVFFKQKRIGYKGKEFFIYKFRTMHATAVPNTKLTLRDDPRVFRFGGLLRKSSLDELPQLFNVLKGDMALIGPRPHMPEARAAGALYFDAVNEYAGRHRVKPGITGWAQINGWRGPTDTLEQIQKRVQHDLYYIENWSFSLDAMIVFRTLFVGFFGKNAF